MDLIELFQDGGRYHIETSPLICFANQWTVYYMITLTVMKGLNANTALSMYEDYGRLMFL